MTTAAEDKKTAAKTTSDGPTAAGEEKGKRAGREKKSPTRDYVRLPSLAPPEQHKDASPAYSRVNHPSPATPRLLFPLHLLFPKPVLCVDFRESGSLGCHRTRAEVYTGGIDDDDDDYGDGSTGRGPRFQRQALPNHRPSLLIPPCVTRVTAQPRRTERSTRRG